MSCFAIVRSRDDLSRAQNEIGALFKIINNLNQPERFCKKLLGIYIYSQIDSLTQACLSRTNDQPYESRIRIMQITSLSGIWTLCWLESSDRESAAPTRQEILDCLVDVCGKSIRDGQFLPVFPFNAESKLVQAEMQRMTESHPDRIRAPLFLNRELGLLSRSRPVKNNPAFRQQYSE